MDLLVEPGAQGDDHPAPLLELLDERAGDLLGGACDDDRVERGGLGPAGVAVAVSGVDILVADFVDHGRRPLRERPVDLDRVDLLDELTEDRRLVARPGADLVDHVRRLGGEDLGHEGDVVGRGDRLPLADRDRLVVVGHPAGVGGEELVPGHRPEGFQDPLVLDAPLGEVLLDHLVAHGDVGVIPPGLLLRRRPSGEGDEAQRPRDQPCPTP